MPGLTPPRALFFNLTHRCNLNCIHCAVLAGSYCFSKHGTSELTLEEIESVAERFARLGGIQLFLAGGEPLLREDVFDVIKCFSSRGVFTLLETNSTLITKQSARKLKRSGLNQISTSIDGMPQTHDSFRQKVGAFRMALEGIKNAKEVGIHIEINNTVYSKNYKELADIAELTAGLGIPLRFTPLSLIGRAKDLENETITPAQLVRLIRLASDLNKEGYMVSVNLPPALLPLNLISGSPECGWGEYLCGLFPDGAMSICPITAEYPEFIAGNMREKEFEDIWHNSPVFAMFRELRQNIVKRLKGVCGICPVNDLCRGSCRVAAYAKYGDLTAPYPICQQMYEAGLFPRGLLIDNAL